MNAFLESTPLWLPGGLVMAVLTAASAFFSASETALFFLSREELRRMRTGRSGERLAAALLNDPDRLLTTVLFWNLVVNLSYFGVSLATAKRLLDAGQATAAATFSLLSLICLIVLGEVFPKGLAVLACRRIAVLASWPLSVAIRILAPALPLLGTTTRMLRRIFWPHLKAEPYLQVDDIERAVESSELGGDLIRIEQQVLGRILELSDMRAEEIMRPRGTYPLWLPPIGLEDLRQRGTLPEYLFIAGEDRDSVARALPVYDRNQLPERNLETLAEKVIVVPWCATVADTLTRLRGALVSVAVVINEYGETVGVITEDDILDTLLNPNSSRGRRLLEREPVVITPEGDVVADGLTTLRYLAHRLDLDYHAESGSPVTVAAMMQYELERFPEVGDTCRWQNHEMRVVQSEGPGEPIQVKLTPLIASRAETASDGE